MAILNRASFHQMALQSIVTFYVLLISISGSRAAVCPKATLAGERVNLFNPEDVSDFEVSVLLSDAFCIASTCLTIEDHGYDLMAYCVADVNDPCVYLYDKTGSGNKILPTSLSANIANEQFGLLATFSGPLPDADSSLRLFLGNGFRSGDRSENFETQVLGHWISANSASLGCSSSPHAIEEYCKPVTADFAPQITAEWGYDANERVIEVITDIDRNSGLQATFEVSSLTIDGTDHYDFAHPISISIQKPASFISVAVSSTEQVHQDRFEQLDWLDSLDSQIVEEESTEEEADRWLDRYRAGETGLVLLYALPGGYDPLKSAADYFSLDWMKDGIMTSFYRGTPWIKEAPADSVGRYCLEICSPRSSQCKSSSIQCEVGSFSMHTLQTGALFTKMSMGESDFNESPLDVTVSYGDYEDTLIRLCNLDACVGDTAEYPGMLGFFTASVEISVSAQPSFLDYEIWVNSNTLEVATVTADEFGDECGSLGVSNYTFLDENRLTNADFCRAPFGSCAFKTMSNIASFREPFESSLIKAGLGHFDPLSSKAIFDVDDANPWQVTLRIPLDHPQLTDIFKRPKLPSADDCEPQAVLVNIINYRVQSSFSVLNEGTGTGVIEASLQCSKMAGGAVFETSVAHEVDAGDNQTFNFSGYLPASYQEEDRVGSLSCIVSYELVTRRSLWPVEQFERSCAAATIWTVDGHTQPVTSCATTSTLTADDFKADRDIDNTTRVNVSGLTLRSSCSPTQVTIARLSLSCAADGQIVTSQKLVELTAAETALSMQIEVISTDFGYDCALTISILKPTGEEIVFANNFSVAAEEQPPGTTPGSTSTSAPYPSDTTSPTDPEESETTPVADDKDSGLSPAVLGISIALPATLLFFVGGILHQRHRKQSRAVNPQHLKFQIEGQDFSLITSWAIRTEAATLTQAKASDHCEILKFFSNPDWTLDGVCAFSPHDLVASMDLPHVQIRASEDPEIYTEKVGKSTVIWLYSPHGLYKLES
eukprot:Clim_evm35s143 gene=Clim_evmTU35s143